jgi:hypothetical protein
MTHEEVAKTTQPDILTHCQVQILQHCIQLTLADI